MSANGVEGFDCDCGWNIAHAENDSLLCLCLDSRDHVGRTLGEVSASCCRSRESRLGVDESSIPVLYHDPKQGHAEGSWKYLATITISMRSRLMKPLIVHHVAIKYHEAVFGALGASCVCRCKSDHRTDRRGRMRADRTCCWRCGRDENV